MAMPLPYATSARRQPAARSVPAAVLGLEQEFLVWDRGQRVDFRTIIGRLGLESGIVDPGDRFAHRLKSGSVITADAREAEIALPPLRRRSGFVDVQAARKESTTETLRRSLPAGLALEGYSTHISVSMPDDINDAVCQLYARTFAPALILLADAQESDGLLLRPRPGRMELGVDYLTGDWLRVALVFAVASVRATAAEITTGLKATPQAIRLKVADAVERFGWYVDRKAPGDDLIANGRATRLATTDGQILTAQEHLRRAWTACAPWLDGVDERDSELAGRMIAGDQPLPSEVERSVVIKVSPARARNARSARSPFGSIVAARHRAGLDIAAKLATWDYTVFSVTGSDGRAAYVSVPALELRPFVASLDAGRLDNWLRTALDDAPTTTLRQWDQTQKVEVYAGLGSTESLQRTERPPAGADSASGDRPGKVAVPFLPVTPTVEQTIVDTVTTNTSRRLFFALIGGVLVLLLIGGGLVFALFGKSPAPAATPTLPAVAVTAPTPAAVVATPTLGASAVTPSPVSVATSSPVGIATQTPGVVTLSPVPSQSLVVPATSTFVGVGPIAGTVEPTGDCQRSGQILTGKYNVTIAGTPVAVQFTVFPYNGPGTYPLSGGGSSRSYMLLINNVGASNADLYLTTTGSVVVVQGATGLTATAQSNLKEQKGSGTEQVILANLPCK